MRLIAILLLLLPLALHGQGAKETQEFCVMTYNVENLFDCRHDTLKNDHEFLPEATRHWTYSKYRKKLDAIARVIIAAGEWNLPALVALCEVENDSVMRDLTRYSALREAGYRYLMTESPDQRGIDVALLYQRQLFKPLEQRCLPVRFPDNKRKTTRDILHVSGLLLSGDTLDVFVCHFPSRSGGAKASEPLRLQAARLLRHQADSLMMTRSYPQILIMGDLNDYPHNRSVREVLRADVPSLQPHSNGLYHLLARRCSEQPSYGSYKYQGEWGLLDHIIVSGNLLLPTASLHTDESRTAVFSPSFLLTEDPRYGGLQPFRTYYGMKYQGGYSDHLPVVCRFTLEY
ncbi:MAG: endonuclease [Bacteroides sp.]|nr:endonuclease [Bacteroides sp.]